MRASGSSLRSPAILAIGLVLLIGFAAAGSASATAGEPTMDVVENASDELEHATDELSETSEENETTTGELTYSIDGDEISLIGDEDDPDTGDQNTTDGDDDIGEIDDSLLNESSEETGESELLDSLPSADELLSPVVDSNESVADVELGVDIGPVNSYVTVVAGQGASGGESSGPQDSTNDDQSGDSMSTGGTNDVVDAGLVGMLGGLALLGGTGAASSAGATAGGAGASGTASTGFGQTLGSLLRLASGASGLLHKLPFSLLRYSRYDDSDPLDHETRRDLYESIEADPGGYLTALETSYDVSLSTIRHHLSVLEDEGLVVAEKQNGKRRYYPAQTEAVELAAALDEPAKANVLSVLIGAGEAHNGRIADELDIDPSTVSHHLSTLEADGLVERRRDGRTIVNTLAPGVEDALEAQTDRSGSTQTANDGPVTVFGDD